MDPLGFINSDGSPTEDGYKYIEWMEAQFTEADQSNDVRAINSLSGDSQHYYVNVYKMKTMTPEGWLRDYKNSIARNGYRNYIYAQEQVEKQSQLEATAQKTLELESGMNALQEALAAQKEAYEQQMEALRVEMEALMRGGKKRASKASAAVEEADDDESEA
jgi:hypothetical protein